MVLRGLRANPIFRDGVSTSRKFDLGGRIWGSFEGFDVVFERTSRIYSFGTFPTGHDGSTGIGKRLGLIGLSFDRVVFVISYNVNVKVDRLSIGII